MYTRNSATTWSEYFKERVSDSEGILTDFILFIVYERENAEKNLVNNLVEKKVLREKK